MNSSSKNPNLKEINALKKKLNWESKTKFINGIKKTFKWYLNNSDYYKSFPKKDIVKRLGTK